MRGTAGNAAAPTASCKNVRRGNFMMLPPQCATSRICNPSGRPAGTDYTRLARRWKGPTPAPDAKLTSPTSYSDQPIQILRANSAVFINNDAPKSPIAPAKSQFARKPRAANTTNRGNETRLNRLIETKPAGPPLSVRYGNNSTAMANSVQLERSRDQPKTSRTMNNNVNQLACPHGFQ